MPIYRTNKLADAVLSSIEFLLDEDVELFLEPYANGRERGWALYNRDGNKVVFSENRNSDSIVVYVGKVGDFEMCGNVPSEKAYKKKEFFSCTDPMLAANRILKYLFSSK